MTEADIKALALFFYFALLDDQKAIESAIAALNICQDRKKRQPDLKNTVITVMATQKIWEQVHLRFQRGLPNSSVESGWVIPHDVHLGPWREFQKNASNDELLTLIWSRILKFSDEDIAEALDLSTGTIRYRLARAVRKLGGMTSLSPHLG